MPNSPQTPGMNVTGPVPTKAVPSMPVEDLIKSMQAQQPAPAAPQLQFVPMLTPTAPGNIAAPPPTPVVPSAAPPSTPPPAANPGAPR